MRPSDPSGRAARSSRFHRAWCASTVVTQVLLTEEADSPTPTWFCLVALLSPLARIEVAPRGAVE